MNKKILGSRLAVLALSPLLLASCGEEAVSSSYDDDETFNGTAYYDNVETRAKFQLDDERNIDESFEDGRMNDDYWNTLDGVWQNESSTYPHNGVRKKNLFYVRDGDSTYLAFRGLGGYNRDLTTASGDYRMPEGACIISKNRLGPGRYEFEMAALPRYGGVSAAWTYMTETGNESTSQNEIDIEIGGEASEDTFTHEWCTSWTKKGNKQTKNVDVSSIVHMNDGAFHKYTFDWYTSYGDTEAGRVDWFIDGILIASVRKSVVTDKEMPLWIGVWFPNWTNAALFDTDYLLLKSARYTAFDVAQPYEEVRTKAGYTQETPSKAGIQTIDYSVIENLNKLANGDFSTLDECALDGSYFGWSKGNAGTIELSGEHPNGGANDTSFLLTAGANETATASQWLESAYAGYKYDLSVTGKLGDASQGGVEIHYWNRLKTKEVAEKTVLSFTGSSWSDLTSSIEMPEGSYNLEIRLVSGSGSAYFSKASLIYKGAN